MAPVTSLLNFHGPHFRFFRSCESALPIAALSGKRVVAASAGGAHSACILDTGELYTWGLGEYGRLGHGSSVSEPYPKLVSFLLLSWNKLCLSIS